MLTVTNGEKHDWANMPLDELVFGNAMDCDFTLRLYNLLSDELKALESYHVYKKMLKDILPFMANLENNGLLVDVDYLNVMDRELKKEIETLDSHLKTLSPVDDINPNSTKDLGEVLFGASGWGLTPTDFSAKTKSPSITEAHLKSFLKAGSKTPKEASDFIESLLAYKQKVKLHKTYVIGIKNALEYNDDGKIYSQYNFEGTVTGRLSCSAYSAGASKKKGVSFHTLPRVSSSDTLNIRNVVVADKKKAFISADFSTAELRVLAQCSRDPELIKAFNEGMDLHKYTASLIYDKPMEKITKDERQVAKSVSFLIVYGGGPFKLAEQVGKSVGYCKSIFKAYQESFPKVFSWIKFVHKYIEDNGKAVSLFGRTRNLTNVTSPSFKMKQRSLRQGMNFVIQSSASDLMLHGIARVMRTFKDLGVDADILATVHDSVEVQCPVDQIGKVSKILKEKLPCSKDYKTLYGLDFVVPFEVDIEVGKSFGDGIEAVFDNNNNLINERDIVNYVKTT